ncbi:MAG: ABC transporter permease, partial [Dehalococcoidales bacterium]
SITGPAGGLGDMGFTLNVLDYLLIALSLFAALLAALCASIILGTFASSYRSAQTLTYPMIGLAMLAMLVTMMLDFSSLSFPLQVMVFLIPFSHPMIAMKELMVGNYLLVLAGIGYLVVITAILVLIATRIFTTDRVVLGMSIKGRKNTRVTA